MRAPEAWWPALTERAAGLTWAHVRAPMRKLLSAPALRAGGSGHVCVRSGAGRRAALRAALVRRRLGPPHMDAVTVAGYGLLVDLVLASAYLLAAFVEGALFGTLVPPFGM